MERKYYRKDWILFQEVGNEGGKLPTDLIEVKTKKEDPETNAHVPFIVETPHGYLVKTGKNKYHSEDTEHHMIFIELVVDKNTSYRHFFKIGDVPEYEFHVAKKGTIVEALSFCNLHGMYYYQLPHHAKVETNPVHKNKK